LGWSFKVGKRYQITIRQLAPLLKIEPGDWVEFELEDGDVKVRKK